MVTIYQDSIGNTMMFRDGAIRVLAAATENIGWDSICSLAYDGCERAKDPDMFEKYCLKCRFDICGSSAMKSAEPACSSFMRELEQRDTGMPGRQMAGVSTGSPKKNVFQGELLD